MGPCGPISSAGQSDRPVEIAAQLPFSVHPRLRVESKVNHYPCSGAFIPSSQGHHLILGSARLKVMGLNNPDQTVLLGAVGPYISGGPIAYQMTKTQLIAALAERTGGDKRAASGMLDALTGIITETVSQGGAVTLPGVGKISLRERPERMARNPSTGEQIRKDADRVVKITVAKALKDSINA